MADKVIKAKELRPNYFKSQSVDIIIPYHGNYPYVSKAISGILASVTKNRYRITLVDDGSPNEHFGKELSKVDGIGLLRNNSRKGMGFSLNYALSETKQDYVCIMHSDSIPHSVAWLNNLGNSLFVLENKNVVMVGTKTDNPGTEVIQMKSDKYKTDSDYILKELEYLPFYCCLCRRDLFNSVGVFKEYLFGGEDVEFTARLQSKNLSQAICGSSWVHHERLDSFKKLIKNSKDEELESMSFFKLCKDLAKYGWKLD